MQSACLCVRYILYMVPISELTKVCWVRIANVNTWSAAAARGDSEHSSSSFFLKEEKKKKRYSTMYPAVIFFFCPSLVRVAVRVLCRCVCVCVWETRSLHVLFCNDKSVSFTSRVSDDSYILNFDDFDDIYIFFFFFFKTCHSANGDAHLCTAWVPSLWVWVFARNSTTFMFRQQSLIQKNHMFWGWFFFLNRNTLLGFPFVQSFLGF